MMAYSATSQAYSATPVATLRDAIATFMAANGWSLVETWTSGARTAHIMKSAVADNGVADFYVAVYTATDSDNNVSVKCGELYDTDTHKFRKYAPYGAVATDTDGTVIDATGILPDSASLGLKYLQIGPMPFNYWISCNAKRVIVTTRYGTSEYSIYAGVFENLIDTAISGAYYDVALGIGRFESGGASQLNSQCAFVLTRDQASLPSTATVCGHVLYQIWPPMYYVTPATGGPQTWCGSGWSVHRPLLFSDYDAYVSQRGGVVPVRTLPDDCIVVPAWLTATPGDTLTYGGKTYVRFAPSAGYSSAPGFIFVDNSV